LAGALAEGVEVVAKGGGDGGSEAAAVSAGRVEAALGAGI